ncbi:MAG TPA: hypothetical protein VJI32_00430 [Candidatus Nanoarchaeia archaeon]|nr:hypothetical protein [Candidatus Nanoarchaeia archaeon]
MNQEIFVYHYTGEESWRIIHQGDQKREYSFFSPETGKAFESTKARGLWPRDSNFISRTVRGLPQEAYLPASYALLEPEPKSWISHPGAWLHLMDYLTDSIDSRIVLLKAKVLPSDNAFIADAALCRRAPLEEDVRKGKELYRDYWRTRIPLFDYRGNDPINLPEVVIQSVIPLERLTVVWEKDREKVWHRAKALCKRKVA